MDIRVVVRALFFCFKEQSNLAGQQSFDMNQTDDQRRQRRIAIALAMLFCVVMVSLGVWSILNGLSTGTTKRGTVASFEGASAQWIGAVQASIGMLPLAIAMSTRRVARYWTFGWLGVAIACLIAALVHSQA